MELAQIVILALCVASVTMHCCFNETELAEKAQKKLVRFAPPPNTTPSQNSSSGCPVELFMKPATAHEKDRSLSPWKYETVDDPEYYPQTYTQAVCLCRGCIMYENGKAIYNMGYNSVELKGTWVFMKREKCKEGGYKLKPERREVTVGCTCVRPS